jgi:transposase
LAGLIRIGDPKVAVPSCFQGFFIYLDSPMLGASWRKYHFVVASTVGPTRTEEDFVKHIEQTVALDPQAGYVFVVDNLNIHQSATLVEWVAQRCGIDEDLGKKGSRGILKSQKTRQEFLSEQSHRIRFVYTPKHSSWLNQIEVIFGVVMGKVIRRGNFTSVEDLRSKLLAFIDYFNAVFAKPFKWTYTGRPLAA